MLSASAQAVPVSAFDLLDQAYGERDRAALDWKEQGGLVVGCLGSDVPEEILIASGVLPIRVCGDPAVELQDAEARDWDDAQMTAELEAFLETRLGVKP